MRVVWMAPVVAAWALLAAAGSGCTTTSTTTPAPAAPAADEDAGADAAPACTASLGGECGDCMKSSCCDALTACEGDPSCAACVSAKDSTACEKTPATHERVDHYLVCKGGACKAACIGDAGGACTGILGTTVTATCATCLEGACCSEVAACYGSAVCWDGCFTNHDETKCHGDPDAHALFHAMGTCVNDKCSSACN